MVSIEISCTRSAPRSLTGIDTALEQQSSARNSHNNIDNDLYVILSDEVVNKK